MVILERKLTSKNKSKLGSETTRAIIHSIQLGKRLQSDCPKIVDDFRNGMSYPKINIKYYIQSDYGVDESLAIAAIGCAIRGHKGSFNIPPYAGLIEDSSELERICKSHRSASASDLGTKCVEEKLGIFGRTVKQHKEDSAKGGNSAYKNKKGFHSLTYNEIIDAAEAGGKASYLKKVGVHSRTEKKMHKDGIKGVIAIGLVPWSKSEKNYAYKLFNINGHDYSLIAEELNKEYHKNEPVRTEMAVYLALYKFRKKLEAELTLS